MRQIKLQKKIWFFWPEESVWGTKLLESEEGILESKEGGTLNSVHEPCPNF